MCFVDRSSQSVRLDDFEMSILGGPANRILILCMEPHLAPRGILDDFEASFRGDPRKRRLILCIEWPAPCVTKYSTTEISARGGQEKRSLVLCVDIYPFRSYKLHYANMASFADPSKSLDSI